MKPNIILIFRILIGVTFIFSGIAKLDSIFQFEQAIFKAGITDWAIIPYLSRFIIAFEILLGLCFFHHEGLKKFTIPATFALLIVFCIHLSYTIIMGGGSSGNCGCFGEKLSMTPWEALIKNIITLGMLVYLYKVPIEKPAREVFIPISLGTFSFVFIFFFFPVKPYVLSADNENNAIERPVQKLYTAEIAKKDTTEQITIPAKEEKLIKKEKKSVQVATKVEEPEDLKNQKVSPILPPAVTSKYAPFKNFSGGVSTNLDAGKKIVCMYNTGCEHCMENAKKICELSKKMKLPDIYILFWGNEAEIPKFFEFSKCPLPYKLLEPQVFIPLLGKGDFPRVTYLHEGNIIGEWDGDNFSSEKLEEALKK